MDFCGCLLWVSKPQWEALLHLSEIQLWCHNCQPLGNQHDSRANLFHVPMSRHLWGLKPRPISPQTMTILKCESDLSGNIQENFRHVKDYLRSYAICSVVKCIHVFNFVFITITCKSTQKHNSRQ